MRLRLVVLAAFCLVTLGCVNQRVKDVIHLQRTVLERYVEKIDETTVEQDKEALKAQLKNWQAIDHYFNGEK